MEFEEYLEEISSGPVRLKASALPLFSKLTPEQTARLDEKWMDIDASRRRSLILELSELTEDNVELDFGAVFRRGLRDNDPDVRLSSIRGLWEDESPDLIDSYVIMLTSDGEPRVRAEAALSLGRYALLNAEGKLRDRHFERVKDGLRQTISDRDEVTEVRARALEAIGPSDETWVRQAIADAYESGEVRLKVSAIHAMGRSAQARWLPLVTRELSNEEAEIRYEAAVTAGAIGDERIVDSLLPLVVDEDVDVRQAATASLGEIGGQRARQALMIMMDSESDATREAAAAALAALDFEEDPLGFKFRG